MPLIEQTATFPHSQLLLCVTMGGIMDEMSNIWEYEAPVFLHLGARPSSQRPAARAYRARGDLHMPWGEHTATFRAPSRFCASLWVGIMDEMSNIWE